LLALLHQVDDQLDAPPLERPEGILDDGRLSRASRKLRIGETNPPMSRLGLDRLCLEQIGNRQQLAQVQRQPP
jgi:hypothetical protein